MIGLLFLAIAGAGRPAHLRVGLLADALPRLPRRIFAWLAFAVLIAFCAVFGWEAVKQAMFNYQRNIRSEIEGWWLFPWTLLIPIPLLVVSLEALSRLLR